MNVGRAGEQKAYSCVIIVHNEIQSNCVRKALIIYDHTLWWSIYE